MLSQAARIRAWSLSRFSDVQLWRLLDADILARPTPSVSPVDRGNLVAWVWTHLRATSLAGARALFLPSCSSFMGMPTWSPHHCFSSGRKAMCGAWIGGGCRIWNCCSLVSVSPIDNTLLFKAKKKKLDSEEKKRKYQSREAGERAGFETRISGLGMPIATTPKAARLAPKLCMQSSKHSPQMSSKQRAQYYPCCLGWLLRTPAADSSSQSRGCVWSELKDSHVVGP